MPRRRLLALGVLTATLALPVCASSLTGAVLTDQAAPVSTIGTTSVQAVTGLTVTPVRDAMVVSWTASASSIVTGYQVYRATTAGGPYTLVGTVGSRTTTTWTDPNPVGDTYAYKVAAVDYNWRADTADVSRSFHRPYFDAVMASTPAYYWRLSDTTGTTGFDYSGNGKNATYFPQGGTLGGPSAETSGEGGSVKSIPGYPMASAADAALILKNTFSFEAWVKPTATEGITTETNTTNVDGSAGTANYAWYPDMGVPAGDAGAGVSVGTNGISVFEHAGGYMPSLLVWQGTVSSTSFTHIVVVYSNKRPSLYVNGALVRTSPYTSTRTNVWAPITLGGNSNGPFDGSVADAAVYGRALSATEIQNHYNAGRTP